MKETQRGKKELLYWHIPGWVRCQAHGVNIRGVVRKMRSDGFDVQDVGHGWDQHGQDITIVDVRHGDEAYLFAAACTGQIETRPIDSV